MCASLLLYFCKPMESDYFFMRNAHNTKENFLLALVHFPCKSLSSHFGMSTDCEMLRLIVAWMIKYHYVPLLDFLSMCLIERLASCCCGLLWGAWCAQQNKNKWKKWSSQIVLFVFVASFPRKWPFLQHSVLIALVREHDRRNLQLLIKCVEPLIQCRFFEHCNMNRR